MGSMIFLAVSVMAATSNRELFSSDANFCPECGAILPLPGLQDVVTCKVCKFQKDTKGTAIK